MRVRALVNVAGFRAGEVGDVEDPKRPDVVAALASGFLEDVTPRPPRPVRRTPSSPVVASGSHGSGSGSGD